MDVHEIHRCPGTDIQRYPQIALDTQEYPRVPLEYLTTYTLYAGLLMKTYDRRASQISMGPMPIVSIHEYQWL